MSTDRDSRAALGLPVDATRAEAQRAFRRLAKETHPDLGGDAAAFRTVAGAWADLAAVLPAEPAAATTVRPALSGPAMVYRSVAAATVPASQVVWSERRPPVRRRPVRPDFARLLATEMARQAA